MYMYNLQDALYVAKILKIFYKANYNNTFNKKHGIIKLGDNMKGALQIIGGIIIFLFVIALFGFGLYFGFKFITSLF